MNNDMMNFMEEIEKSMVRLRSGEVVTGKVINVTDNEIMVNVGYKSDGIIPRDEISNDTTVNPKSLVHIGDEIKVYVIKVDDGEGNVLLSKKRVDVQKGWDDLEKIMESEALLETKVIEAVRGGVVSISRGIRCFIPASQLSDSYVENLQSFVGKSFNTKIIEIDRKKNKVVLSRKPVMQNEKQEKRKEVLANLKAGQLVKGTVRNITNFGAFIDLGGVDGLIHISDLSWNRVKHPSDILKLGDQVEAIVLEFDATTGKISLGLKQTAPQPWDLVKDKYSVGDVVEGKVVRLVDFGAFIEIENGVDGLVHISEISDKFISKPSQALEIGQAVKAKILDINVEQKRMSLSIAAINKAAEESEEKEFISEENQVTIGDIINPTEE